METGVLLLTLLHILVLVYWLGGDLGAFYSSRFIADPARSVAERALAMRILDAIDMAPRTALILALPTGLTLAAAKGWVTLPGDAILMLWVFYLAWLALAWAIHLRHGPGGAALRRIDLAIRWIVLAVLLGTGAYGLGGGLHLPWFIAAKLLILGIAVGCGLLIRLLLRPIFAPFAQMMARGPTPATDTAIAGVLARTRPIVLLLWALILCAAWLGVATPV